MAITAPRTTRDALCRHRLVLAQQRSDLPPTIDPAQRALLAHHEAEE